MIVTSSPPLALPQADSPEGERVLINAGPSEAGSHEVASWLFCPRWWAISHIGDHAGRAKEPFIRGGLMHTGLAHHYLRWALSRQKGVQYEGTPYTRPDEFYSPLEAMRVLVPRMPQHEQGIGSQVLETCQKAVAEYLTVATVRDSFHVVSVEEEHRMAVGGPRGLRALSPLPPTALAYDRPTREAMYPQSYPNPGEFLHTARLDMVIRESDGVYIVDHKCLPASATVATPLGPVTVGSLLGKGDWLCQAFVDTRLRWAPANEPVPAGVQPTCLLQVGNGPPKAYGMDHPIWVWEQWGSFGGSPRWVIAGSVHVGDLVATPSGDQIRWEPVTANHVGPDELCYHIEVPEHRTFVANGVVTHNTTMMTVERALRMYRNSVQLLVLHQFGRLRYGADFRGVRVSIIPVGSPKKYVQVAINSPLLVNDMPALLHWARTQIHVGKTIYGSNVRAYPPTGVSGSCLDPVTGGQCDAFQQCSFG